MDLKDVAAIAGKSGLYRVLKPTKTGVILESLDGTGKKSIASGNSRVSVLKEISIYTTGKESSVLLEDLFETIHEKHGRELAVNSKSDANALFSFLEGVLPDYDRERVYHSDLKKLVSWYNLLDKYYPELFEKKEETKKALAKEGDAAEEKAPAKKSPAKAKKSPAKKSE